jgi:hypothetical protein
MILHPGGWMKHGGRAAGGRRGFAPLPRQLNQTPVHQQNRDYIRSHIQNFPKGVEELFATWAFIYRSKIQYRDPPSFQNMAKIDPI